MQPGACPAPFPTMFKLPRKPYPTNPPPAPRCRLPDGATTLHVRSCGVVCCKTRMRVTALRFVFSQPCSLVSCVRLGLLCIARVRRVSKRMFI